MKARVKFYDNLFDACDEKNGSFVTMYADTKQELVKCINAISDKFSVTNVFIDDGTKKEEKTE